MTRSGHDGHKIMLLGACLLAGACGGQATEDGGRSDASLADATIDASAQPDGARIDAGADASGDATMGDASALEVGTDADGLDAGVDAQAIDGGSDASSVSPDGPTNVVAVARTGCVFDLSWQAPANTGTSPITGYQIDSSPVGLSISVPTLTYTTPALSCGTSYVFSVSAINSAGAGPAGSSAAAVAGDVPGLPASVLATAPSGRVFASWGAAADDGYAISSYTVTLSPGGMTQTLGSSATRATFAGLTVGTMYSFAIYATNALGDGPVATSNVVTFACTNNTYTLAALESCSVEYGAPPLSSPDGNVEARRDPRVADTDLRGFVRVSLSTIPSWARIRSIQLALNAGIVSGGSAPAPVLQLLYSPDSGWTRAMIPTPSDIGLAPPVVSAQYPSGAVGWQYFDVDVAVRDWSTDLAAGYLTLGIQNINSNYSFNTYYGTDTGPGGTAPFITIGTCE